MWEVGEEHVRVLEVGERGACERPGKWEGRGRRKGVKVERVGGRGSRGKNENTL